jgi:hypothetical protein
MALLGTQSRTVDRGRICQRASSYRDSQAIRDYGVPRQLAAQLMDKSRQRATCAPGGACRPE